METSPQNSSMRKNILTHQIKELQNRKNDKFDFESDTEDLDDLADEIFEALYEHTSKQINENTEKD
jgi:precorrin-2 methylase